MSQTSNEGGSRRRARSPEHGPDASGESQDHLDTRQSKARRTANNFAPAAAPTVFSNIFPGGTNNRYKAWLNWVTPAGAQSYANFVGKRVEQDFGNGQVWSGTVQSITQGLLASQTRTPALNAIYPTKSRPFTIVWSDDTDSAVSFADLQTMLSSSDVTPRLPTGSGGLRSSPQSKGAARRHAPPPPAPVPNLSIFKGP